MQVSYLGSLVLLCRAGGNVAEMHVLPHSPQNLPICQSNQGAMVDVPIYPDDGWKPRDHFVLDWLISFTLSIPIVISWRPSSVKVSCT